MGYALPILSGALLALGLYPFYVWPVLIIALVPLYYFLGFSNRRAREAYLGGFISSCIGFLPTIYFSAGQIFMAPAHPIAILLKVASPLLLLGVAGLFGGAAYATWFLRSRFSALNIFLAASVYVLCEGMLLYVFDGYYLGSLAHALAHLPSVFILASFGGTPLVVFVAICFNASIAEIFLAPSLAEQRIIGGVVALALCIFLLAPFPPLSEQSVLSVAIVQGYLTSESAIQDEIRKIVGVTNTEFVVYPYSIGGALLDTSTRSTFANDMSRLNATTVLTWENVKQGSQVYEQYILWHGTTQTTYTKHTLFPFSDYVPSWVTIKIKSASIAPGNGANTASVGASAIGGLACSELQNATLARERARGAAFFIAIGTDSFVGSPIVANFSLAGARYRAAENNMAMIRGNIIGPSAIINPNGSVQTKEDFSERGVIYGTVPITGPSTLTLYNRFGSWPLYISAIFILALALICKLSSKRRAIVEHGY